MATRQEEIIVKLGADTKQLAKELGMTRNQVSGFVRDINADIKAGSTPDSWKPWIEFNNRFSQSAEHTKLGLKHLGGAARETFASLAEGRGVLESMQTGFQGMAIGLSHATAGFAAIGVAAATAIGYFINAGVNTLFDVDNIAGLRYKTTLAAILQAKREIAEEDAQAAAEASYQEKLTDKKREIDQVRGEQENAQIEDAVDRTKDFIARKKEQIKLAQEELNGRKMLEAMGESESDQLRNADDKLKIERMKLEVVEAERRIAETKKRTEEETAKAIADQVRLTKEKSAAAMKGLDAANARVRELGIGHVTVADLAKGWEENGQQQFGPAAETAQQIQWLREDAAIARQLGNVDYSKTQMSEANRLEASLQSQGYLDTTAMQEAQAAQKAAAESLADIQKNGVAVKLPN